MKQSKIQDQNFISSLGGYKNSMYKSVSVIIPTYNRKNYILKAIESLLNQTILVDEIIIIDDGSTDSTYEFINKLNLDRVKIHRYNENKGQCYALNIGMQLATGEIVSFLDSDNYLYCNWNESMQEYFRIHPWCKWLYPCLNPKFILDKGTLLLNPYQKSSNDPALNCRNLWKHEFEADPNGLMIFSELLYPELKWDENIKIYTDYDFALQLSKKNGNSLGIHPHVLGVYERSYTNDSISAKNTNDIFIDSLSYIQNKYIDFNEFIEFSTIPEKILRYESYKNENKNIQDRVWEKFN